MAKTKVYNIVLTLSENDSLKIKSWRKKLSGSELVDAKPPHVTLKRRFALKETVTEEILIETLQKFSFAVTFFYAESLEKWGENYVLIGKNALLKSKHFQLIKAVESLITSLDSMWEGRNFKAHVNVLRTSQKNAITFQDIGLEKALLDKVCLYEYDPAPIKKFARIVWSKHL